MPSSPVPPSSPIIPVSPPSVPCIKVEVSEPLDRPPPRSRHPRRAKTPYVVPSLSPSPPLVVSPVVCRALTILIPPRDTPILVLPTLRKRACREPSPPAKKRCPANTSMSSYYFLYFFIPYSSEPPVPLWSLFGPSFLELGSGLVCFSHSQRNGTSLLCFISVELLLTSYISFLGSGRGALLPLLPC